MASFVDGHVGAIFNIITCSTIALTLGRIARNIITVMRQQAVSITSRLGSTLTNILRLYQNIRNRSQYQQSPSIAACSNYPHLWYDTKNIRNIGQTMRGPPSLHNTPQELHYLLGYIIQNGSIAQDHDSLQPLKMITVHILVQHFKDSDKAVA
jgi:hypothetical protein